MRIVAFTLLALFTCLACRAQPSNYTAFTVKDGLPSNNIYRVIEDNAGFLWVATDAGIARFDGKRFQVFNMQHGLPDNDVLAVVKEKSGRIWINCFKQGPAYFDEIQNRFISAFGDTSLKKAWGTKVMFLSPLPDGRVVYNNENGSFIFKDKKYVAYKFDRPGPSYLIKENKDGSQLRWGFPIDPLKKGSIKLISFNKGKATDSADLHVTANGLFTVAADDGKLYIFNGINSKCYIYSFGYSPHHLKTDSVTTPKPFFNFSHTRSMFYMVSSSRRIYVFNKKTLKLEQTLSGNYLPNSFYNDSKGNLWVATMDKGLVVYRKNQLQHIEMQEGFTRTDFFSIARTPGGAVLAGNYYGEVIEAGVGKFTIHKISDQLPGRQRKILVAGKDVFSFSEEKIAVNYKRYIKNQVDNLPFASSKTAIIYNDSMMMVGGSVGLVKLNYKTRRVEQVKAPNTRRVTTLAKANNGMIYFGSTDGLYKYDYKKDNITSITKVHALPGDRMTALCVTPDDLLWVGSSGNGIAVLKNDKLLAAISEKDGIISNSSRSITAGKPGQVWLGTAGGISVINYTLNGNKINYTTHNLSVSDGLTDNAINEMLYQRDTVYAATGNGISIIPANYAVPKFDIPVKLISVSINQRDTIVATSYKLNQDQQNIQMQFAGIELNGHFKHLQYKLDKGEHWINLNENTLALQLSQDEHILKVRAIDVNGNCSNNAFIIKLDIATPFWKTAWFWIILASVTQILIIYLLNRWQKRKKEAMLAKKIAGVQTASLEQQAFTSLMNPHFMFNALNSIQHYINLQDRQNANRYLSDFASLIRKNFEAAQQSFIPLEQELENIKIYLRLEQMRFNDRFLYRLMISENLDVEDWMIPTMILQPLLENALLHGIMPSAINGELLIDIKQQDNYLLIIITDNGIGMANSLALKENSTHKSRGTELIKKRISALSRFGLQEITITMAPAFDNEKNPGNRITLYIPDKLHEAWLEAQKQL